MTEVPEHLLRRAQARRDQLTAPSIAQLASEATLDAIERAVLEEAGEIRRLSGYEDSPAAERLDDQVRFYRWGRIKALPPEWEHYLEKLDPEYEDYLRLKKKFEK